MEARRIAVVALASLLLSLPVSCGGGSSSADGADGSVPTDPGDDAGDAAVSATDGRAGGGGADAGSGTAPGAPGPGGPNDAAIDGAGDGGSDVGPYPLGATWGSQGVHFRVRSDPASAVELDLYATARGAGEVLRIAMTRASPGDPWAADVTHAALASAGLSSVVYYGYRAWGPNWPKDPAWSNGSSAGFSSDVDGQGNRFNPNKLLIDPYAHEISHDPIQPGSTSGSDYTSGGSRAVDDGPIAPKSIVVAPDSTGTGTHPGRPLKDDIVYEVHVRGLTMNDTSVASAQRGTYAGAATKAASLAALGVTAIELLPIQETQNDQNDAQPQGANYWGYTTIAFFAPDRRYASDKSPGGPTREFKAMVAAFHAQGIKVFLDVVYNHTAEGSPSSSDVNVAEILSMRGLDNAGYYELAADHAAAVDNTGVGGNINAATDIVRNLVIDSLSYWSKQMGVDGFRFDVAPVLGNACASACFSFDGGDPQGIVRRAVTELPGIALIAEPWGEGNGTYQEGKFPSGWSEWNGDFRDTIRSVQNELGTISITPSTLSARLTGSPDIYNHDGRAPWATVNYVDCHDGFTLHDEYAYNSPQNDQAYPYGPSTGGSTTNDSWDQDGGADAQEQAARTGIALVALSSGVPMMQGGDEMLRTQHGNNNAYNLDDSAMWLDPSLATTNAAFVRWTGALFSFRTAHPALRPAKFFDGTDHDGNGLTDVAFFDTTGAVASSSYMGDSSNHFLALRIDGQEGGDTVRSIYVAYNGWSGDLSVTVPAPGGGKAWWIMGDSAAGTFAVANGGTALGSSTLTVKARSVAVLVER